MRPRAVAVFTLMLFLMGGIILRLYSLADQQWTAAADQQASLTVTVANARGTLYDCAGLPLVNTVHEYRASVVQSPTALTALQPCMTSTAFAELTEALQAGKPAVARLTALPAAASGLTLFQTPVRYSDSVLAPHVVGYMDSDGIHGAFGAELVFDDRLTAASGSAKVTYTVDAVGQALQGVAPVIDDTLDQTRAGVALTIDSEIQQLAESVARQHIDKGAVVVMEPDTGRIRAMVSLPDFQPTALADSLDSDDAPFVNRCLSNYNIGSVFKIVTAAAALEAGVPLSTAYPCTGSVTLGDTTLNCHNKLGHGTLTMSEAFAQSCNPYFIQLAQRVGGSKLYAMAAALGFDRPIYVAEGWKSARAVLPSEAELLAPAAVANLSIGQGGLLATPLHLAQLVGAVLGDGMLVRPTLLQGFVEADGTLTESAPAAGQYAFSAQTAATLRTMLAQVVSDGTGAVAKPWEGTAAGKTGTAETGWKEEGRAVVQSWFGGYYTPAEGDTPYVVVVLVEDYQASDSSAAAVFKQFCEEFNLLDKLRRSRTAS